MGSLPTVASTCKGVVLFVDDDDLVVELGQEMLACLGYSVIGQTDSREALALFRESPYDFDLVLTDFHMPGMKGDSLAQQLWDIRPDIPIILCTSSWAVIQDRARLQGFDALLSKPFQLHDMGTALTQALAQRGTPQP